MCSIERLVEQAADVAASTSPENRLRMLASLRQAVDAAMVVALAEIESAPGPIHLDGAVDAGDWLAARSELHPAEAAGLAGLARVVSEMPATSEALEGGRIGAEKARLLSTAFPVDGFAEAEPNLVERIVGVSLRSARRIIGRFIADHRDPAPADAAANEVTLSRKRDGRWKLDGDLDAESGMLLANELRRLAEAHRGEDDLRLVQRTALAVLDMARRSVTLGERSPGSRPELVIVADAREFGDVVNGRFEDGTPIDRQVFEKLCCDANVRGLLMNGRSEVLDLGRSQRLGTPGQRRAAAVRDGGCVFPDCDRPPEECDLHHIRHWLKHHGFTDLANLCLLCRAHHNLTHTMGFTFVRRRDDSLTIYRRDGSVLLGASRQAA